MSLDDGSPADESSDFFLGLVGGVVRTGVAPDFGAEDDNGDIWVDFVSPGYISDSVLRLSTPDSNPVEEGGR